MILSARLEKVLRMIPSDLIVADIGCDHAMLPIELVKRGISPKVYAIDNKVGPLESAKANVIKSGVKTKIELLLQDGLKSLPDDVEVVNIAGVGGLLAIDMLKNASRVPSVMILQVNNHIEELRKYLTSNNFKIIDEEIVLDSNIYYEIIKVVKGEQKLTDLDIMFGVVLRNKKSDLFIDKWTKQKLYLEKILDEVSDKQIEKKHEINYKINKINEVIS